MKLDRKVKLVYQRVFVLTPEDQVAKAEILQALHMVKKNPFVCIIKGRRERICAMFADSMIVKSYSMADTKSQNVIKFGISDYLTKKLMYDVNIMPYSFLFDEPTINQVKNNMMDMFHTGHQGMIKLFLLMLVCYLLDIAMQMT